MITLPNTKYHYLLLDILFILFLSLQHTTLSLQCYSSPTCIASVVEAVDGTLEDFAERHDGFAAIESERLQFLTDEREECVVVGHVDLNEEVVDTRGLVTLHNFGYALQLLNRLVEFVGMQERKSEISAGFEPEFLRIDIVLSAAYHSHCRQFLDALMDGSTAHAAGACHFEEWYACIVDDEAYDFSV